MLTKEVISMKKFIQIGVLVLTMFFIAQPAQAEDNIMVLLDGTPIIFDTMDGYGAPFIDVAGRTQLPLRKCVEALGANVMYNQDDKQIIITADEITLCLKIGDMILHTDEKDILLDTEPVVKENRTYIPIRPIAEALGYQVKWQQENQTIIISRYLADESIEIVDLSMYLEQHLSKNSSWLVDGKNLYYYYDNENCLVKANVNDFRQQVQLVNQDAYTKQVSLNPIEKRGSYILYSYATGGMIGTVQYFLIAPDGAVTTFASSTMMPLKFTCADRDIVVTGTGEGSNLEIWHEGKRLQINEPNIVFNRLYTAMEAYPAGEVFIWQDKIYTSAYQREENAYYLAQIDCNTKEVTLLVKVLPKKIRSVEDALYYLTDEGELYCLREKENIMIRQNIIDFTFVEDTLYIADKNNGIFVCQDGTERQITALCAKNFTTVDNHVLIEVGNASMSLWILADENGKLSCIIPSAQMACYDSGAMYIKK